MYLFLKAMGYLTTGTFSHLLFLTVPLGNVHLELVNI